MLIDSIIVLATFQFTGFAAFTVFEILLARKSMAVRDRLRGLQFALVSIPVIATTSWIFTAIVEGLGIEPIVTIEPGVASLAIGTVLAALWSDFTFYWFHRFQHRFLWRFHAVHHSIRNVTAINAYHHWTEPLFSTIIIGIPLMLVKVDFGPTLFVLAIALRYWSFYIHSPVRLHLGPLSRLIIDNRFHRLHHSLRPEHHDRNFAAILTVWDWMFGTLAMPAKGEWPAVGLAYVDEPKNLVEWESLPRRLRRRAYAEKTLATPAVQAAIDVSVHCKP